MSETIRNPTEEEIKKMLNEKIPKGFVTKEIEKDETQIEKNEDIERKMEKQIPMKKSDEFEPEPLKFKLPSRNKVVSEKYLTNDFEIFVRRLSLVEEGMFTEISKKNTFYFELNKILRNCIKTDISEEALSSIDKIPLLIFILAITYGRTYNIAPVKDCKTCTLSNEVILDLVSDIKTKYVSDDFQYPLKFKLELPGEIYLTLHYPKVANEDLILYEENIYKQISGLVVSIDGIKSNGKQVTKADYANIISYLSEKDKKTIKKWLADFSSFGIQTKTDSFSCKIAKEEGKEKCYMYGKEIEISFEKIMELIGEKINK